MDGETGAPFLRGGGSAPADVVITYDLEKIRGYFAWCGTERFDFVMLRSDGLRDHLDSLAWLGVSEVRPVSSSVILPG